MASLELHIPILSHAATRYSLDSKTLMNQKNNQFGSYFGGI